ncbi:VIT1/CCC1 transporter family protein [Alteromonas sp. CI.11.F.A3]|uniref:VIT1/CCC1 transporter family protein n=1 Tax=Alteromonas sp. CI.11.F.A3 TaxID=3079555 RepID=UPI0029422056|nr:VIT1/CCC1 transporter family protein [Alteromonas sp. CI.11.F.A3]WOI39193.1 VIT1/CCC1 transporter family protein [Alteromonas sp. CI.11.F.A3]
MTHSEIHRSQRVGWLRAAVLGANDGIVSTASLIIGVAAASTSHDGILLAGAAGLVAGAMSMAAGEYVSVSSQSDTENADLAIEKKSLEQNFESEIEELAKIYEGRGLNAALGATAARVGGASITVGAIRVTFWGALAMALTAVVGRIFGVVA